MKYYQGTEMGILPDYVDAFIFEKQMNINCNLECKIFDSPDKSTLILTWRPASKGQYSQQFLHTPRNKSPSKRKRNFKRANTWRDLQCDSAKSRDRINNRPSADTWSYGYTPDKSTDKATYASTPAASKCRELDLDLATPDSGCNTPPPSLNKHGVIHSANYTQHTFEPEFVCEQYSEFQESCIAKTSCSTILKGDNNYACSISTVSDECTCVTITDPAKSKCDTKTVRQDHYINKNSILFSDEDLCLNRLFDDCDNFDFCFDRVTLAEGPRYKKLRASYGPIIVYMNLLNDREKYAVSPEIQYQEPDSKYHWKHHRHETDISRRAHRFNSVKHHVMEMKDILIKYLKEHNLKFPKQQNSSCM